jgi:CelD/BcsL family acetyltransferase involved in cellulose biosynthesis
VNKFAQHCGGALAWRSYRTPDELREFHALARQVSARTYQERLLDAGLPGDDDFVAALQDAARQDLVRAFILFHGERPVSYLHCPVEGSRLVYAYLGYDPEYLSHSVGTVLFWLALESLFAEGRFAWFDFTEGESDHKRLFATQGVASANVHFLRPTPRLRVLLALHRATGRFSGALGLWLDRHGIKARVKRWLRFGLRGAPRAQETAPR